MSVKVKTDFARLDARFSDGALKRAQTQFAQRVAFDMRQHVLVDTGALQGSEPGSSDYEGGEIVWNTPYARYALNAKSARKAKNPNATPNWPEVTKAEKMGDWEKFAEALLGGGR